VDWSGGLKAQLRSRAEALLSAGPECGYRSAGTPPTVLFLESLNSTTHGNFFEPAWSAINANPEWAKRLLKSHAQRKALPPQHQANARETDSSNSSDALLMNCVCPPGASAAIAELLGASPINAIPEFGWKARVNLTNGKLDVTEVDMRLGDLLVEAKLTESNFTECEKTKAFSYAAIGSVFDVDLLPGTGSTFGGYQLIRNVLAAAQHGFKFTVLIDSRRPDLLNEWWTVHSAIRSGAVRGRCRVRFWQEVAAVLPKPHREFLDLKYGL